MIIRSLKHGYEYYWGSIYIICWSLIHKNLKTHQIVTNAKQILYL